MKKRKITQAAWVILINLLIFLILFLGVESAFRIHRDGFSGAFSGLVDSIKVPYSNLGTSNWVVYDKDLGYRLNPNSPKTNRHSIKNGEIEFPKPEGLYRIVYLGDSIPWDNPGFVNYSKEILEEQGRYEIINASVPGYTTYQELLLYKKYLVDIKPDLVIWTYCLNDNHKFLHKFDEKGKMLWTDEARNTFKIDTYWGVIISRSYVLSMINIRLLSRKAEAKKKNAQFGWERSFDFSIAWKDYPWAAYEKYLIEFKTILKKQNSKLAIVVFPFEPQIKYRNNKKHIRYVLKPQRKIRVLCEKHQVPCLDLYSTLSDQYDKKRRMFRDGIHLNLEGHKLVSDAIVNFLHQNDLLAMTKNSL
ncbi:SGNH/GDSL hydrolase family protein [Desulfococcaceae bacterium HSG9]|nr:SGNH/GDSL hydrolase family protein [Desulfococcaceae bacterium HSG9]